MALLCAEGLKERLEKSVMMLGEALHGIAINRVNEDCSLSCLNFPRNVSHSVLFRPLLNNYNRARRFPHIFQ